jgi:hypothetical protein
MTLPERRTGMIDRDLAIQPFWQLGPQVTRKRIERRDLLGAIAKAHGAALGEPELDSLSWIIDEWHQQGAPLDGALRFTWYALGRDLYGRDRASWAPSGRHRQLMKDAIDHLHEVVVTLRSINVHDGDTARTLRSKVHILETVVYHGAVDSYLEDLEQARDDQKAKDDVRKQHGAPLGRLREDSVEVTIAAWLVRQLLTGTVVLDWRTQRTLAGAAKRLWYQLSALAPEFEPTSFPDEAALTIILDTDFYAAMHLQAARDRDNRAALAAAGRRIVAADDNYRAVNVVRRADGGYELRVIRRLEVSDPVAAPRIRGELAEPTDAAAVSRWRQAS